MCQDLYTIQDELKIISTDLDATTRRLDRRGLANLLDSRTHEPYQGCQVSELTYDEPLNVTCPLSGGDCVLYGIRAKLEGYQGECPIIQKTRGHIEDKNGKDMESYQTLFGK